MNLLIKPRSTGSRFRVPKRIAFDRRSGVLMLFERPGGRKTCQPRGLQRNSACRVADRFNFSTTWGFDPATPQNARDIGFITRPARYA
jgi:hypothetical protein